MMNLKLLPLTELLQTKVKDIYNKYGDNYTADDVAHSLADLLEKATDVNFKVSCKTLELDYIGKKFTVHLEIHIHYDNSGCYEFIQDITSNEDTSDVSTVITQFQYAFSVLDIFTSDTLQYFGL